MKTKHSRKIMQLLCCVLIFIMCIPLLVGCESRPLSASKQALAVVGTVGEYEVTYEELYFLASNYKTDGMSDEELWELVCENITSNYAILTLCDEYSVDYDENELDDAVQAYVDNIIENDFGGSRGKYLDSLEESHLTDHYVRFTARVDTIYDKLTRALISADEIETDEKKVTEYIEKNFVRTWHFMIANNDGDDIEENRENAQKALDDLRAGNTTMYKLIGSAKNEDLLITLDGYSFARGSMEKSYEDAAFALGVGEYSEVVSAKGELASGEYTDCYYVMQRLPLDKEYIKKNYSSLFDTYEEAIVAEKLDAVEKSLEFVPNEYAKSLDISDLEPVGAGTDVFLIVVICICSALVVGVTVTVILLVIHFKKKNRKMLEAAKAKRALSEKNDKK